MKSQKCLQNRGFPKVDHSDIDARIVLEQNKFSKQKLALIGNEPLTLGMSFMLHFALVPCHCARSYCMEDWDFNDPYVVVLYWFQLNSLSSSKTKNQVGFNQSHFWNLWESSLGSLALPKIWTEISDTVIFRLVLFLQGAAEQTIHRSSYQAFGGIREILLFTIRDLSHSYIHINFDLTAQKRSLLYCIVR